jgi:hypothetical protein
MRFVRLSRVGAIAEATALLGARQIVSRLK